MTAGVGVEEETGVGVGVTVNAAVGDGVTVSAAVGKAVALRVGVVVLNKAICVSAGPQAARASRKTMEASKVVDAVCFMDG